MSGMTLAMVVGAVIILAAAALAFLGLPADEPAFVEPAADGEIVPAVAA
jgi:hypothetical protein